MFGELGVEPLLVEAILICFFRLNFFTNFKPPGSYENEWNLVIERAVKVCSLANNF